MLCVLCCVDITLVCDVLCCVYLICRVVCHVLCCVMSHWCVMSHVVYVCVYLICCAVKTLHYMQPLLQVKVHATSAPSPAPQKSELQSFYIVN